MPSNFKNICFVFHFQIFQCLSEAMGSLGYDRPAEVCRNKLKTLRLRFNALARARARSGAGTGEDLPNQDLLEELLGGRPVATCANTIVDLGIPQADPPVPGEIFASFVAIALPQRLSLMSYFCS